MRILLGVDWLPVSRLEEIQTPLEWETPLFQQALTQFEQALTYAGVSDAIADRLRVPERWVLLSVPVRLDSGQRAVFPAYRVQHSSVLGPTKGGIRYDPHVSLGECAALAIRMCEWLGWRLDQLRCVVQGFGKVGGVTVSYFEWVQDLGRPFWDREEIRGRLADKLGDVFDRVWRLHEELDLSLRTAALAAGVREVAAALDARGLNP